MYHFIGLGGIGMSALARVLMKRGKQVQGSDASSSALLEQLKEEGASVYIGHNAETLATATAVIYSSAVKSDNVELQRAKQLGLPLLHRSDFLNELMRGKRPLLVTGTHGKTTTTSLLAAVFLEAQEDPSFVVGGLLKNLNTNGHAGTGPYFIAEADESDGSFLKTPAFGAIVTNLEDEHLDYWKTSAALDVSFTQFFNQVQHSKHLFWCGDDARLRSLQPPGISYGFDKTNGLRITSLHVTEMGIRFDLFWNQTHYRAIDLALHGEHNALNGAAVFGLALSLGISEASIRSAFRSFAGAARRLDWKGTAHAVELYDDYGHHPTEIAVTIQALREKSREKRLVAVFQPHRYTRVRDLFDAFITCFDEADLVIMTDIYSAGEAPIDGINSAALFAQLRERLGSKAHFIPRAELEIGVASLLMPHDVVLTLGAGDITKTGEPILQHYRARAPKLTLGILFGGTSAEHDVSLMSARRISSALDPHLYNLKFFGITKEGHWICGPDALTKLEQKLTLQNQLLPPQILEELTSCDAVFPIFHGPQGEDGMFQGFLDTLNIPYVGCDYRAGALTMHKAWTKHLAICHNVPTAAFFEFDRQTFRANPDLLLEQIDRTLTYPVWIKPVHLGSSIGVHRAATPTEALAAASDAFTYDDTLIIENEINGIQVEFAILGNEHLRVAQSCEILNDGFHSYTSKYGPTASGMAIPARIPPTHEILGAHLALAMYRATNCKGMARVDFFYDTKGHFWLNEINPFPGFTATSAYPSMWEQTNLSLPALCHQLLILALQRHRRLAEIRGK